MTTVPCAGGVVTVKVSGSPSASVAVIFPFAELSSLVVIAGAVATGASLVELTVTEMVTVVVPPLPSLIVTVKVSAPL
ncbi:hypothetical protein D3C85_956960 [compost metagenome]